MAKVFREFTVFGLSMLYVRFAIGLLARALGVNDLHSLSDRQSRPQGKIVLPRNGLPDRPGGLGDLRRRLDTTDRHMDGRVHLSRGKHKLIDAQPVPVGSNKSADVQTR
jgi:hypothetical protein